MWTIYWFAEPVISMGRPYNFCLCIFWFDTLKIITREYLRSFRKREEMTVLGEYKTKHRKNVLGQARTTFFILGFALSKNYYFTITTELSAEISNHNFLN